MTQPKIENPFPDSESALIAAIQDVAVGPDRGRDISFAHAHQLMQSLLDEDADPVRAAVVLIALRMKRESEAEMRGLTAAAQARVHTEKVDTPLLVTLVDPFDGYSRHVSISAFLPAVLAACGTPCLIHGVETVGPKFGVTVHQVLKRFGEAALDPSRLVSNIEEHGWGYADQSHYLPSLNRLIPLRNRIVKRTAITTFERVLSPVSCKGQNHLAIGYVHKAYPEIYAAIAQQAGFGFIHLHKGVEGGLMIAQNKPFARFSGRLDDGSISLSKTAHDVGSAASVAPEGLERFDETLSNNARIALCRERGLDALKGEQGTAYHTLVAASANILCSVDASLSYSDAVEKAREQIDNGQALARFESVVES